MIILIKDDDVGTTNIEGKNKQLKQTNLLQFRVHIEINNRKEIKYKHISFKASSMSRA